jgi:DNA-binding MarR family transcriptional regulator
MLEEMAQEIFELYLVIAIARSRRPAGPDDLSETEFLTLDILSKEQPLTIGEVQKRIGVLPAQMSRIVRALEEQGGRGYVECRINAQDRRRVDISLTSAGEKAHNEYRSARLGSILHILSVLNLEDRTHFMRILRQIHVAFDADAAVGDAGS